MMVKAKESPPLDRAWRSDRGIVRLSSTWLAYTPPRVGVHKIFAPKYQRLAYRNFDSLVIYFTITYEYTDMT